MWNVVGTADLRNFFSKVEVKNWTYDVYTTAEVFIDSTPTCLKNKSHKRNKEASLRKTELTLKENKEAF